MTRRDLTPAMLAHLRKQGGTVWFCRDCEFVGIGRPVSLHTLYHEGHRLVTEREFHELVAARELVKTT